MKIVELRQIIRKELKVVLIESKNEFGRNFAAKQLSTEYVDVFKEEVSNLKKNINLSSRKNAYEARLASETLSNYIHDGVPLIEWVFDENKDDLSKSKVGLMIKKYFKNFSGLDKNDSKKEAQKNINNMIKYLNLLIPMLKKKNWTGAYNLTKKVNIYTLTGKLVASTQIFQMHVDADYRSFKNNPRFK